MTAISRLASTSGTQPPSGTFTMLAMKNTVSRRNREPNTPAVASRDQPNCRWNTTAARKQVHRKVPVTAMP